ncbi:SDR family NAD(P)-dependent oxidoreductase [Dactylosporangium fulvum]|uniref:SDR family oxidoreductase n=1 Tax=Dactylosporangium fulvum TaxID=53359 RepID=A0ABY5VSQ5_9ACTN|nr:SDR family oxidoreductase [Dactylosporangium fulvum]UWP80136.1 SDR family oxidoreductase [Dactylosporangium fulvum]
MTCALVAGGATGIGRATVRALRAAGTDVYLADLNDAAAREVAAQEAPGRIVVGHHDLADRHAPEAAVAAALQAFGRLDHVVVTAGLHVVAPLESFQFEAWEATMAVNVRAPYLLAQAAMAALADTRGSIVFTGSTAAHRGSRGTFAYAASKGALISLTRSLAVELAGSGIRVNSVCPGWIDTPFNDPYWKAQADTEAAVDSVVARVPLGRQGDPEEVAALIVHLLSPASAYITGQSVVIDGGLLSA